MVFNWGDRAKISQTGHFLGFELHILSIDVSELYIKRARNLNPFSRQKFGLFYILF